MVARACIGKLRGYAERWEGVCELSVRIDPPSWYLLLTLPLLACSLSYHQSGLEILGSLGSCLPLQYGWLRKPRLTPYQPAAKGIDEPDTPFTCFLLKEGRNWTSFRQKWMDQHDYERSDFFLHEFFLALYLVKLENLKKENMTTEREREVEREKWPTDGQHSVETTIYLFLISCDGIAPAYGLPLERDRSPFFLLWPDLVVLLHLIHLASSMSRFSHPSTYNESLFTSNLGCRIPT